MKKKSSNKISECNNTFDDTYKYNICIDYRHVIKRDEQGKTKKVQVI